MSTSSILDTLYEHHYRDAVQFSEVTSSHWRQVGWHKVLKTPEGWKLEGRGFGSRRQNHWGTRLLRFPSEILVGRLLKKFNCPPDLISLGRQIAERQQRHFDYDCARHVLTLAFLEKWLPSLRNKLLRDSDSIVIIGDTYGYLGGLIHAWLPGTRVIEINLGRTLFFDAYYLGLAFPGSQHMLYSGTPPPSGEQDFVYLEAEGITKLTGIKAWLYINIASMQEMDPDVARNYLQLMRHEKSNSVHFYCCNREEKQLPDGTITRFDDYGWRAEDQVLVDEPCPWLDSYPTNFPPGWKKFDGPFRQRLSRLAQDRQI